MHPITRKLFLYHVVLLAGCSTTKTVEAKPPTGTVSLSYIARLYTMRLALSGGRVVLKNKYNAVEFETNGRRAYINGIMVWLHHPCRQQGREWTIREVDFKKGIDPILRSYAYLDKRSPRLVVLDPGHGGKDTGAIGGQKKIREKDVVLSVAMKVKARLEANKVQVRLTRSGDSYPTLTQRTDYAYKVGADLFVSIHADGAGDSSASGVETFIMTAPGCDSSNQYGQPGDKFEMKNNKFDASNAVLGFNIQGNMVKNTKRSDRGLRRARFAVLKNSPCPAALVECGFLTNPDEEALLNTTKYRDACARGIANGILAYFTLAKRARK